MVQGESTVNWWKLTPDNTGSYTNGTWTQLAIDAGRATRRSTSRRRCCPTAASSSRAASTSTTSPPSSPTRAPSTIPSPTPGPRSRRPSGWTDGIGDAQSVVLADGTFMLANCCNTKAALLNADYADLDGVDRHRQGRTQRRGGLDAAAQRQGPDRRLQQHLEPHATPRSSMPAPAAGRAPAAPSCSCPTSPRTAGSHEIGPAVLRPDGTVFAARRAPATPPLQHRHRHLDGRPRLPASASSSTSPTARRRCCRTATCWWPRARASSTRLGHFFEFDGTSMTQVPARPNAAPYPSYDATCWCSPRARSSSPTESGRGDLHRRPARSNRAWVPTITTVPSTVSRGSRNNASPARSSTASSQGAAYGDDAQAATNYPLVRITNNATGHVFYARTHDHSTMGVATGSATVSTAVRRAGRHRDAAPRPSRWSPTASPRRRSASRWSRRKRCSSPRTAASRRPRC